MDENVAAVADDVKGKVLHVRAHLGITELAFDESLGVEDGVEGALRDVGPHSNGRLRETRPPAISMMSSRGMARGEERSEYDGDVYLNRKLPAGVSIKGGRAACGGGTKPSLA